MHNLLYCFPTPIFSTVNEQLADEILPVCRKFLTDDSLVNKDWNYKTTYSHKYHIGHHDDMKLMQNYLSDLGTSFIQRQGYKFQRKMTAEIFTSEMFKGDCHDQHTHPNYKLSGVFYLNVPDGSPPITFIDPRPKKYFTHDEIEIPSELNDVYVTISPKKGLLLMWESWLEHFVPRCENIEGRVTLVFNLR